MSAGPAEAPGRGEASVREPEATEPGSEPRVALYRCRTPTDYLCPCGAVARRLRKLGIEHRTVRLPYRKRDRPEVEELTGQRHLPMLIDGDEVVHDSKRILEYLEWRHGERPEG